MIGGFYICALEPSEAVPGRGYTCLVAGPFASKADAEAKGAEAFKLVKHTYKDFAKLQWNVCEFYYPRLVSGSRNRELWVTVNPIERN